LGLVRHALAGDVIGAYLFGSAVLGGLRPTSDLDILVVTGRRTSRMQRRAVIKGLLNVSGDTQPGVARPVELTLVAHQDVRPWQYPPSQECLYGEWLRAAFERGAVPEREVNPDLAVLITMVLRWGIALAGPPPTDVFDQVPREDLVRGAVHGVPQLLGDLETDTRNVVLTLARVWATVETGEVLSKDEAAQWALDRLPPEHRTVLAQAREMYLRGTKQESCGELSAVHDYATYVATAIQCTNWPNGSP
jgi:predicted nucleotidyltransferase